MAIARFEDLDVWREAHALVVAIYGATRRMPAEERFGLTAQMRTAAVSIPANIVEGFKRQGTRDKQHFYNIAQSSLEELRYYTILCRDLGLDIDAAMLGVHAERVGRLLTGFMRSVRR